MFAFNTAGQDLKLIYYFLNFFSSQVLANVCNLAKKIWKNKQNIATLNKSVYTKGVKMS